MNWYSGSIAEAVQQSKLRNAIFVVFVEGPNENSKRMADLIDTESVRLELESSKFVAIRIQSDTESYTQFAQIYKLVPLPSVFFLGDNGSPLAIATEVCNTVDALHDVIRKVQQSVADQAVAPPTAAAAPAAPAPTVSNTTVNATASSTTSTASTTAPENTTPVSAAALEERVQRAKALLEEKRKQDEAEKQRLAKERELERRRSGQDLRSFKERQTELELKQLKEERKRDLIAEQVRRKRILEQIAQDRAMSAARFANNSGLNDAAAADGSVAAAAVPASPRVYTGNEARIQFRKPDGTVAAHDFLAADTFQTVRDFVATDLLAGCSNFTLASSFPRRLFGDEDTVRTLAELDLAPTAVILVQSTDKSLQTSNSSADAGQGAGASSAVRGAVAAVSRLNVFGLAQSAFWMLMMPVLAVFGYVRSLLGGRGADAGAQKRANEERVSDNDAAKRRNLKFGQSDPQPSTSNASDSTQPTAYKRTGGGSSATSNIHRLRDTQDSDDETNTWNGNSTQQQ